VAIDRKGFLKRQSKKALSNQLIITNQLETLMNLTQTQQEAKNAYLNIQQEKMLALYKNASLTEKKAIIKNIDSFLPVTSESEKVFWLKFRRKLEMMLEPKFSLGRVFLTNGAKEALNESNQSANEFLSLHQTGNWGIVGKEDAEENEFSLKNGFRLLSAYKTSKNLKLWIITEADRSSTTVLLPSEY
jgi:hypothetical protein